MFDRRGVAGVRREFQQAELLTDALGVAMQAIREVVAEFGAALLVLQLPAERIVAASPAAREILRTGNPVGRLLTDLTSPGSAEATMLLSSGRINGYQTRRGLSGDQTAGALNVWLRGMAEHSHAPLAIALLCAANSSLQLGSAASEADLDVVIGGTDQQFVLDRLGDNVEALLGYPAGDLLGQSLVQLVAADDVGKLLFALAQVTSSQQGVSLSVRLLRANSRQLRCQLVLLPLTPEPSCALALQPAQDFSEAFRSADEFGRLVRQVAHGIQAAGATRDLAEVRRSGNRSLAELTSREAQIVSRLLAGDRVPAIALQLFLAQSTVRNHLSAVFAKFGVRSQQELIVLLRQAQNSLLDS